MRSRRVFVAATLAVGLSASLVPYAGANHQFEYIPQTTKLFMRNSSTACPGTPFLSIEAGSGEPGCGYQGGAPFGELYHAGAPVASTIKAYTTQDGMPQYLDPSRNLVGSLRIVATATTNRMAVGQIRVDLTFRGVRDTGATVILGSSSTEKIVDPTTSAQTDFPFTVDLANSLDKALFTEITVDVDIRGWHVLTGYHRLNGESWLDLPTFEKRPIPHP